MRNRSRSIHTWPRSIHSQVEAAFQAVRAFGTTKDAAPLEIRSIGTWRAYRYEAHRFADFLAARGCRDLLDAAAFTSGLAGYLGEQVARLGGKKGSLQTLETTLGALFKLELALNRYAEMHALGLPALDTQALRRDWHRRGAEKLRRYCFVTENPRKCLQTHL